MLNNKITELQEFISNIMVSAWKHILQMQLLTKKISKNYQLESIEITEICNFT